MRALLIGFCCCALAGLLSCAWLYTRWQAPLTLPPEGEVFEVHSGESLRSIADRLAARGAVSLPSLLIVYGRLSGLDAQLKKGEYHLPSGTNMPGLLQLLRRGEVLHYQVTIPEGLTLAEAVRLLQRDTVLESVLKGPNDARILQLTADYPSPEGLFLPETYRIVRGDSDWDVLQRAHRALLESLAEAWQSRAEGLPLETAYEALVLASIIERETGVAQERSAIAGVFVRRLLRGMRLQTDPSVIYGLGDRFDGNLKRSHLKDADNVFNTYRHHGLPPTPIALPGVAALQAAVHPEDGDSLYFVARGDGSHVFSASLEAHQRAVRKYQLNRRPDYQSRPGTP